MVGPYTGGGVALDTTTGIYGSALPKVDGSIYIVVPDGSGGWYIGGEFTKVGDITRNNIAHILADKTLDTVWNPNADDFVNTLAIDGSTIYVGGDFSSIGGQNRNNLAALDKTTGLATAWNPDADGAVYTLAIDGSTIYVGGGFSSISGENRKSFATFDLTPAVSNPLPVLTNITPTSATEGDPDLVLTATGTDFISTSTIDWNGTPLVTTYVSATELTATIPAANLTTAGTANVTVTSPAPGGGTSDPQVFTIEAAPVVPPPATSSSSGSRPRPKTVVIQTETVCPLGANYSSVTGLPCTTFTNPTNPSQSEPTTCTITLTLRQGNTGEQVKCLQTKLNILKDGIFGPMTKAAVILFQKNHNLVPDGIVGPLTRGKME